MKDSSASYWNKIGKLYAREWTFNGRQYISSIEENFLNYSINQFLTQSKIKALDLGVGAGRILSILEKNKRVDEITGVDMSEEMLNYCKKIFRKSKKITKFMQVDISKKLPFPNRSFDLVTSIRVIKYNKNWRKILKEVNRVIKENGVFIFEMPNANSINRLSKIEVSIHKTTLQKLKQALKESNFKILKIKGGPILPGFIYSKSKGLSLNLAASSEMLFKRVLGKTFLSRFLYVCCRKI